MYHAIQFLGEAKVRELVFTAEYVDANKARRTGLMNNVLTEGDLDEAVDAVSAEILSFGPQAVTRSK